jgi:hypothetical protein
MPHSSFRLPATSRMNSPEIRKILTVGGSCTPVKLVVGYSIIHIASIGCIVGFPSGMDKELIEGIAL